MQSETKTLKTADFIIYPDLGRVEVNNKTIRLGPVNMKVLLKLVYNQDKVVSRTELFDTVWNNQVISDDALTKCISEIRTKLGQYSNHRKLILTIPKKGYQWSPSNVKPAELENLTSGHKLQNRLKYYFTNLLLVTITVLTLTTSFLWLTNKLTEIKYIPILLLPIESFDKNMESYKNALEDSLRENILETQNIRFLSKLALLDNSPYSIINTKYNYKLRWAIEARVRKLKNVPKKKRVSLNLIDTRTGVEVYTQSIEIEAGFDRLDEFSEKFFRIIEKRIIQY